MDAFILMESDGSDENRVIMQGILPSDKISC
jgi:hypothetical protein